MKDKFSTVAIRITVDFFFRNDLFLFWHNIILVLRVEPLLIVKLRARMKKKKKLTIVGFYVINSSIKRSTIYT